MSDKKKVYSAGIVTAYGAAIRSGYEGTFDQFSEAMAALPVLVESLENMTVKVNIIAHDVQPSGTYADGTLTLNIPQGERGETGKSSYQYAVEGGYTGTEAEFEQLCADLGIEVEHLKNMTVIVNQVTSSSAPSATYVDGTLTINVPAATDAQVSSAVGTWLDENVDPTTGYVLDRTLTQENAAAPADLVGDLKESIINKAPIIYNTAVAQNNVLRITDAAKEAQVKQIILSGFETDGIIKICGKNLVQSVKNGYYDTSNGEFVQNATWRATELIRCNAGETFVPSSGATILTLCVLFYDESKTFLNSLSIGENSFTTPINAYYMAFYGNRTALTTDFQIELGSTPTEYEPYIENVLTVTSEGSAEITIDNPNLITYNGTNSILYDSDGIVITYCADTKLYFEKNNNELLSTLETINNEINREYLFQHGTKKCVINVGDKLKITNNSTTNNASVYTRNIYGANIETISSNLRAQESIIFTASEDAEFIYFYSADSAATFTVEFLNTVDGRLAQLEAYHESKIPSYYENMLNSVVETVRNNMMAVGKSGDTFIYITDIHWENNAKKSPALIEYIINHLNINKIFCGGDLITQGKRNVMAADMLECVKAYTFPDTMLPIAFGNHDSNWVDYGSQREDPTRRFDVNAVYALICKQCEPCATFMTNYDCSLYIDNDDDETRYIFLDTGEDDSNYRIFTAFDELALILNSTPLNYKIVIVSHIVTYGVFKTGVEPMLDAYNAKGTYTYNEKTYNFTDAKGHIVIGIGGHVHDDTDHTTTGGIPIITTTCDRVKTDSESGTTDEQAFEVITLDYINNKAYFVRVGRGVSRTFNLSQVN